MREFYSSISMDYHRRSTHVADSTMTLEMKTPLHTVRSYLWPLPEALLYDLDD